MEHPSQHVVPAETSAPPQYRGVGGWLLFFIVTLTIIGPAFQGYVVYNEWRQYQATPSPLLFNVLAVDWSMRVILVILGIYVGIRLWRVKPGALRTAKVYLLAACVQPIVLVLVGLWIISKVAANPGDLTSVLIQPLRPFIYVAIWYSYLSKSERVAATYPAFSPSKL